MRLLFAGTPSIALPALGMLNEQQEVVGVLTAPDKPGKRGKDSVPSPIKTLAEELSLPVLQFERLGSEAREEVTPLAPELLVVAAYGKIFGPKFLSLFSSGGINLHPSLLPRHRGPSPIQETILSGDETAGVTIQTISLEVDAGDILLQKSFPLTGREQAPQLEEKAAETGAELLAETVRRIEEGTIRPRPQDPSGADYCRKITKHDGLIDWHEDARTIDKKIRAFVPWPGSWTWFSDRRLTLLRAEPYPGTVASGGPQAGSAASTDPAATGSAASGGLAAAGPTASGGLAAAGSAASGGTNPPGKVLGIDKASGILIQTGHGILSVQELKLQGKRALNWRDFLNGTRGFIGAKLEDEAAGS